MKLNKKQINWKEKNKVLFKWIVLCEEGYGKTPSSSSYS